MFVLRSLRRKWTVSGVSSHRTIRDSTSTTERGIDTAHLVQSFEIEELDDMIDARIRENDRIEILEIMVCS